MTSPFSYVANMQRIRTKGFDYHCTALQLLANRTCPKYVWQREETEEAAPSSQVFTLQQVGTSISKEPVRQSPTSSSCLSLKGHTQWLADTLQTANVL